MANVWPRHEPEPTRNARGLIRQGNPAMSYTEFPNRQALMRTRKGSSILLAHNLNQLRLDRPAAPKHPFGAGDRRGIARHTRVLQNGTTRHGKRHGYSFGRETPAKRPIVGCMWWVLEDTRASCSRVLAQCQLSCRVCILRPRSAPSKQTNGCRLSPLLVGLSDQGSQQDAIHLSPPPFFTGY